MSFFYRYKGTFRNSSYSFTDRKGKVCSPIIGWPVDFMLERSEFGRLNHTAETLLDILRKVVQTLDAYVRSSLLLSKVLRKLKLGFWVEGRTVLLLWLIAKFSRLGHLIKTSFWGCGSHCNGSCEGTCAGFENLPIHLTFYFLIKNAILTQNLWLKFKLK